LIRNIAILSNPRSGKGRGLNYASAVALELDKQNIAYQKFHDYWPNSLEGFTHIYIVGGDGTFNYALNKYYPIHQPVAFFAAGTGNDFCWKLYGDVDLRSHVSSIIKSHSYHHVDIGKCNDGYFLNTIGLGFDGEILKDMSKVRWIGGHLGYLIMVIKNIFTFKEKKYKVSIDGGAVFEAEYMLCSISNAPRTGGGFMLSPLARVDDGKLNLLLVEGRNILQRFILLAKIKRANHLNDKIVNHSFISQVKFTSGYTIYYQRDGELHHASHFDIGVLTGALKIIIY
jgi:diacylglycerol kinase (ATP)